MNPRYRRERDRPDWVTDRNVPMPEGFARADGGEDVGGEHRIYRVTTADIEIQIWSLEGGGTDKSWHPLGTNEPGDISCKCGEMFDSEAEAREHLITHNTNTDPEPRTDGGSIRPTDSGYVSPDDVEKHREAIDHRSMERRNRMRQGKTSGGVRL